MDRSETADASNTTSDAGFPEPFALSLLLMVICGAVGAFAADLVADGRIDPPGRSEQGYMLGFLGKMIVGSVAAIIALCLNPSGDALWSLIGTALTAGVGGESILRARAAASQAEAAERDAKLWAGKLDTLGEIAIAAHRDAVGEARDEGPLPAAEDGFARIIETYVARARAEMAPSRASQPGSAPLLRLEEETPSPTTARPAPTV